MTIFANFLIEKIAFTPSPSKLGFNCTLNMYLTEKNNPVNIWQNIKWKELNHKLKVYGSRWTFLKFKDQIAYDPKFEGYIGLLAETSPKAGDMYA